MHIGIIAESTDNAFVIRALCQKIASSLNEPIKVLKENQYITSTQVLPRSIDNINNFFLKKRKHKPIFLVILTDRDNNFKLKKELENSLSKLSLPTLIAMPEEKIEKWLVADVEAVNKVLKYKLSNPHINLDPKLWLGAKIGESNSNLSYPVACVSIAKQANLNRIKNGFSEFANDFKRTVDEFQKKAIKYQ